LSWNSGPEELVLAWRCVFTTAGCVNFKGV
jgi:hypothetical protein